jgi:hypothetical protein
MTDPHPPGDRREEPALVPDEVIPNAVPKLRQAAVPAPGTAPGQAPERYRMPPDPACYEIRFRLGYEALLPIVGLLLLAMGVFAPPESLFARVFGIALGGLYVVPYVILLVTRTIVFRADQAGITLGPELPMLQFFTVFIPWADIKKITLYKITRMSRTMGKQPGTYIGIVPHDRAPADPAARRINTWRLDRERLAAVTKAAAPGTPIADAGEINPWDDAGRAVLRQVGR